MRPDDCAETYLQTLRKRLDVEAVLMLPDPDMLVPFREGTFYLIVVNQPQTKSITRRLHIQGKVIVEQQVSTWQLEQGTVRGFEERFSVVLKKAVVVWEKDSYMSMMKQRLYQMPRTLQNMHICREYSQLLRFFCETKECLNRGMSLDAYHAVILSLHAWARCIIYEAGERPACALWSQVKLLDPSVYKLYEELSINAEALDKRIELLLLAIEFWLSSSMKESVRYVLEIMETKPGPWRLSELMLHDEMKRAKIELPLLLEKMVQRSVIREVSLAVDESEQEEICFILSE
jgi:Helix-turn-helix domain